MAERVETIRLTAQVSNFLAGMEQARKSTSATATAAQKLASQGQAFTTLGTELLKVGAVAAAGVGLAVAKFAEFDAKMSQVQALSHATGDEMKSLSDAALHVGQAIGFSASEVADAETELVKAGVSVQNILGGALTGALQLAAAGQIDVADATEIATVALTQFKLQGKDVPHVADLLAAGADKALGSVGDLGEALKSGGLVAAQFGVSLDETVGTLSAFANAGLLGETAGTDLRQALLKLANPSTEASDAMKKFGINVYDTSGKFIGMAGLAGQLQKAFKGQTDETRNATEATIFGSRAINGANVLYAEGAKGIKKWTDDVNDSGFAAEQAAAKMNNLKGDVSKLGAAFDTDLIESGSNANQLLRGTVQEVTALVTVIGNLPGPVLGVGLGVTALVAGVALLGGGFLTLVPKINATRIAMQEMNLSAKSIAVGLGKGAGILLGLTALASGLAGTGATSELAADQIADVDKALDNLSKKNLTKLFAATGVGDSGPTVAKQADDLKVALNQLASGNFFENSSAGYKFIDGMTFGISHLSDVYKTNEAQFKELGKQISLVTQTNFGQATKSFASIVQAAGGGKEAIRQLLQEMPDYKAQLIALAADQGKTLTQQQLFNLAVGKGSLAATLARDSTARLATQASNLGAAAADASGDITDLANQINDFGKAQFDVDDAARAFQQAIDDATEALKNNGTSLDITTQKGRDNSAALEQIAKTAIQSASAIETQTGSQEDASKAIADGRQALIDQLAQFGIVGQAAQDYADKLGLIPSQIATLVKVDTSQAEKDIDLFLGKHRGDVITFNTSTAKATMATGGLVRGPGSGTSDSIPAALSNGEFITRASATSVPQNRAALEYMNAGGTIGGYANGGYVAPRYASTTSRVVSPSAPVATQVPVTIKVTGETDPAVFAAQAGQAVAIRVRGVLR